MTGKELKDFLVSGRPVRYNGIEYSEVSAIKYQYRGDEIVVSAELLDKNKRCIVVAPCEKVEEVQF